MSAHSDDEKAFLKANRVRASSNGGSTPEEVKALGVCCEWHNEKGTAIKTWGGFQAYLHKHLTNGYVFKYVPPHV
jgi:hypothetical protein